MKKSLLLIAAGVLAIGANAQSAKKVNHVAPERTDTKVAGTEASYKMGTNLVHYGKATISQIGTIPTVTFGGALPAGWTVGHTGAAVDWKWINTANTNYIDLASASAADGWMVCDIGDNTGTLAVDATLTSPTGGYNFTGHAHVGIMFTEYYTRFEDSCYIDVNNGAGWVSYPVNYNNSIRANGGTANAYDALVNISATAGNQAAVQIRFHFKGSYQGYEWHVDDMKFMDLDPVDNRLERSAHTYKAGNYEYDPLGTLPTEFFIEARPYSFLSNYGYNAQTNVSVSSTMVGPGPAYSHTQTVAALPITGFDSTVSFAANPYTSTVPGTYKNGFAVGSNSDTAAFALTDTAWVQARPSFTAHGYYLQNPTAPASFEYSTFFTVPYGKQDTLTTMNVSLYSGAGQTIEVQIYTYDGSNYTPVAGGSLTLAASDVSNSSIIWSSNIIPAGANPGPVILDGGTLDSFGQTYYATVKAVNATAQTVVWCADAPAFPANSYFGLQAFQDTSDNLANTYSLGAHTIYAQTPVPLIRLNFGTYSPVGVKEVTQTKLFQAYPNPANNTVTVPFTPSASGKAYILLTNVSGQVLKSETKDVKAGEYNTVNFSTSGLANGVYFYTVEVGGQRSTERFTVAH